ncbi:hypothetical protein ACXR0O_19155 [Verrucomicrobiota bacterium sgz303538]
MALSAITVARRHGGRTFEVVIDASVHPGEHKAAFRELAASREHPEFAEVQIWESNVGVTKSKKFREVTPDKGPEKPEDEKPQDEKPEAENSEGDTSAKTSSEPSASKKKAGSSK